MCLVLARVCCWVWGACACARARAPGRLVRVGGLCSGWSVWLPTLTLSPLWTSLNVPCWSCVWLAGGCLPSVSLLGPVLVASLASPPCGRRCRGCAGFPRVVLLGVRACAGACACASGWFPRVGGLLGLVGVVAHVKPCRGCGQVFACPAGAVCGSRGAALLSGSPLGPAVLVVGLALSLARAVVPGLCWFPGVRVLTGGRPGGRLRVGVARARGALLAWCGVVTR